MKTVLLVIAGVLTAGGASWLALPAVQNENHQVPADVAPVRCHSTAVEYLQASSGHDGQSDCSGDCGNCVEAKDQDGDGRCDAAKDYDRHSGDCDTTHQAASCHTNGVVCPGTDCGDCKDFKDADGDGGCDRSADCGKHSEVTCPDHGKGIHGGRGRCHAATLQPETSK